MRCGWCILMLAPVLACSEARGAPAVQVEAAAGGEEQTVLFRCEEGRVAAYVVTGPIDSLPSPEQMVRISLDSAPDC